MDEISSPPSQDNESPEPNADKHPLTIAQMAEKFGVTYRALRFYQQKGLLAPKRKGTARLYRARDVAHMKIIMEAKRTGLALSDVREVLSAYHHHGTEKQNQIIVEKLRNQEKLLTEQHELIGAQLEATRQLLAEREKSSTDI